MPRRKRNRRNRRRNHRQQHNVANLQNTNKAQEIQIQETPQTDGSNFMIISHLVTPLRTRSNLTLLNNSHSRRSNSVIRTTPRSGKEGNNDESNFMTLPHPITPLRTPSNSTIFNNSHIRSNSAVCVTPRSAKKENCELNATNLCKLFDQKLDDRKEECLNNITPKCRRNMRNTSPLSESYINNFSGGTSGMVLLRSRGGGCFGSKMRSNSSISKLRSPGLDKIPIMVDVATQTVYFDNNLEKRNSISEVSDIYLQNCINIFETPKISQLQKLERAFETETPLPSNIKDLNASNLKYLFDYISPKVIQNDLRNNESEAETSFFSPQLKTSSTPIENLQKSEKLFESMAKNILNAHIDRKLLEKRNDKIGSYITTPKTDNKLVNRCDDKIFTQKVNKVDNCIYKKRIYKSISPRKLKDLSCKLYNNRNISAIRVQPSKNDTSTIPKSFSPQRMSFSKSDNFFNVSNANVYARFMTNIKKLHNRYSAKWLDRITDICNWLGITIRRRLSTLCASSHGVNKTVIESSDVTPQEHACSNCNDYQEQIMVLTTRVDVLDRELHEDKEKIDSLREEIGKMKEELSELDSIKMKIGEIELKLKAPSIVCAPPPPPPPPLPPLPPPLPTSVLAPFTRKAKTLDRKNEKKSAENSRPVISLDDILNVKLKKTTDKPHIIRRATQPFISVEMLSQIKLKPTSRPDTPSSTKETSSTSSILSSSPATSLTKILSNVDTNVRRIKRLRRVSRFSLDDSRKLLVRRERCGNIDDS